MKNMGFIICLYPENAAPSSSPQVINYNELSTSLNFYTFMWMYLNLPSQEHLSLNTELLLMKTSWLLGRKRLTWFCTWSKGRRQFGMLNFLSKGKQLDVWLSRIWFSSLFFCSSKKLPWANLLLNKIFLIRFSALYGFHMKMILILKIKIISPCFSVCSGDNSLEGL